MYIDAKTGFRQDLRQIIGLKKGEKAWAQAIKDKRTSLYYIWEDVALRKNNDEAIWSREGCYTWKQSYDRVNQWAQYFIAQGIKPGELVAFYLHNSPDFMFAWFGLWAIGAAPAMINYNLAGKALVHCLKISGSKILLVDNDADFLTRIGEVKDEIMADFGMSTVLVDDAFKAGIASRAPVRPGDEWRVNVQGGDPMCLLYTRYVVHFLC